MRLDALTARALVVLFAVVMSACVLGLIYWKSAVAREAALARSEIELKNLTHSLTQHATHTLVSAEIMLDDLADGLSYREPSTERFRRYLADAVRPLPQLRDISVIDANGKRHYSSTDEPAEISYADREYFIYHRTHKDAKLYITPPLQPYATGRSAMQVTRRINGPDGRFAGVLVALIDSDYWSNFYKIFPLGDNGSITLLRADGAVLTRWPSLLDGGDVSQSKLFQIRLKTNNSGFYRIASPADGSAKYVGYEQLGDYPVVVAVAQAEDVLLEDWRSERTSNLIVALVLLAVVIALAAVVSKQIESRLKAEKALRERDRRYQLLADNVADIVVLFDRDGIIEFISQSIQAVLGRSPQDLIGKPGLILVHPDDVSFVREADAELRRGGVSRTVVYRCCRDDGRVVWMEANVKIAERENDDPMQVVGVLRDVSERKQMEDELKLLNTRLGELATTDGLTGLANRRTFDQFLRGQYWSCDEISVILFDIDHFKSYNDRFGHQAGDECLTRVSKVIAEATEGTSGMSARYGGEEFVIVLPGLPEHMAFIVAEAVRLKVGALEIVNPAAERGYLSMSAGIASKSSVSEDCEAALLGDADRALYEAKWLGRNCTVRQSPRQGHSKDNFDAMLKASEAHSA
jgi:diguanylate cyclase (GGDEF)-like protein/PAS domain S-box-containing protein